MANTFNTDIKSRLIELQTKYLFDKMYDKLKDRMSRDQISAIVAETMRRYYVNIGRPLTILRDADPDHLPYLEDYNETMSEMAEDTTILYQEIEAIGKALADNFNYIQSERQRITHRIKGVGALTNDLNLLANETTPNSVYFRDSFINEAQVEAKMIMGAAAQISTREGVVTLGRTDTVNRSIDASIKLSQGDGEAGTQHLVRKIPSTNQQTTLMYLHDQTPNDDPNAVLDGRPDTIFEYQMVNIGSDNILSVGKGYDFDWAKGAQSNDKLRLKLIIELKDVVDVNWINIDPYNPAGSTGKVTVYSIRTSEDGFEYKGLYSDGNYVINSELNTTPQTYRQDEIFDGKNDFSASKFAGQGVWSFATRKAKYVEVVFDQTESYPETIGHTYYQQITTTVDPHTGQTKEVAVRIPATSATEQAVKGAPGKYLVKDNIYINKAIDQFNGWRYAIGLRDVAIMSYQFAEKSELVTTRFSVDKPIKEVMLYANEKIPEAFLQDLSKANDWIQYYFSLDDVSWYRISPTHQNPTTGQVFTPKIFSINGSNIDLQSAFQLYKGYITTSQPAKNIRLKMVFQRPTNIPSAASFTPILEDYALRLVFEEGQ